MSTSVRASSSPTQLHAIKTNNSSRTDPLHCAPAQRHDSWPLNRLDQRKHKHLLSSPLGSLQLSGVETEVLRSPASYVSETAPRLPLLLSPAPKKSRFIPPAPPLLSHTSEQAKLLHRTPQVLSVPPSPAAHRVHALLLALLLLRSSSLFRPPFDPRAWSPCFFVCSAILLPLVLTLYVWASIMLFLNPPCLRRFSMLRCRAERRLRRRARAFKSRRPMRGRRAAASCWLFRLTRPALSS